MTSNKYIVKNCPAFNEDYNECCGKSSKFIYCMDNTDCVIKQVTEKCTNVINTTFSNECFELAKDITNLFDIEEINK